MGQTIGSSWAKSESQHNLANGRFAPIADDQAGSLPQLIIAGTTQTVRSGFSVTTRWTPENGELASRADYAGRVDLHLERRAGLGRANALYLDQG